MDVTRIIDLPSKTYIEEGDYIAIDNQQDGTQKVQFTNLFDSSLSQSDKIAPANIVGQQFTNTNTEITALRAAVGSPLKASTVAQMTDTNKIYVYTGSESGYTNGNWYYYNGTAWASGGVYNSIAIETDKTLTVSDMAADAKVVGDDIADLKSEINDVYTHSYSDSFSAAGNKWFKFNVEVGRTYIFTNTSASSAQVIHTVGATGSYDYIEQIGGTLNHGASIKFSPTYEAPVIVVYCNGSGSFEIHAETSLKKLDNDLFTLNVLNTEIQNEISWVVGTLYDDPSKAWVGTPDLSYTNRLVTVDLLPLYNVAITGNGYIAVHGYDKDFKWLGSNGAWEKAVRIEDVLNLHPTAKYMRVVFRRSDNSTTLVSDVSIYGVKVYENKPLKVLHDTNYSNGLCTPLSLEYGSLEDNGLPLKTDTRIVHPAYIKVEKGEMYELYAEPSNSKTLNFAVSFYNANDFATNRLSAIGWSYDNTFAFCIPDGVSYIRIILRYSDNSVIDQSEIKSFTIKKILEFGNNYAVGSDLIKRAVDVSLLGKLVYAQAFCKYDNKYYSTDGSHIAEQDADFDILRNTTISIGHGNSLQLGSNGKAYASGWDDNKIYVVNLSTLSVDSYITLPTTGYTTCAVDDINGIVYIFQRDSYPDHEDNYNFIVYDYVNDEVKLTKKTLPFAAMQSIDLFNDILVVLNGLGSVSCPNGYRIYDTNGNIISEYKIGYLASREPEGIFVDRDSCELLISEYSSGNSIVYRITHSNN